jgi:2-polyprenyl-3-methyl-5-hydroxy-6-metoxy-1,4-benzoquinol methylase
LPWDENWFDALILSEVIEHLVDPWSVLRKIRPLMKSGARVFASSPNVSHFSVLRMLWRGDWTLEDSGLMDRTHLRWFTPRSYRELFESTGYRVDSVRELAPFGRKARFVNKVTFGRWRHLLTYQIDLRAHCL